MVVLVVGLGLLPFSFSVSINPLQFSFDPIWIRNGPKHGFGVTIDEAEFSKRLSQMQTVADGGELVHVMGDDGFHERGPHGGSGPILGHAPRDFMRNFINAAIGITPATKESMTRSTIDDPSLPGLWHDPVLHRGYLGSSQLIAQIVIRRLAAVRDGRAGGHWVSTWHHGVEADADIGAYKDPVRTMGEWQTFNAALDIAAEATGMSPEDKIAVWTPVLEEFLQNQRRVNAANNPNHSIFGSPSMSSSLAYGDSPSHGGTLGLRRGNVSMRDPFTGKSFGSGVTNLEPLGKSSPR